jgi:hypothetical protein
MTTSSFDRGPPSSGGTGGTHIFDMQQVTRKATAQPNTISPARWTATPAPLILDCSTTPEAMMRAAVAGESRQLGDNLTT